MEVGTIWRNNLSNMSPPTKFVYKNKYWIDAVKSVMTNGWKAQLSNEYINLLRKQLSLKINIKTNIAYYVFQKICNELIIKTKKHVFIELLLNNPNNYSSINLPTINKDSWDFAFLLKLNNHSLTKSQFYNFLKDICNFEKLSINKMTNIFYSNFDKKKFQQNFEDIMYFLNTFEFININNILNPNFNDGFIINNKLIKEIIKTKSNYDKYINDFMQFIYFKDLYLQFQKNILNNNKNDN